MIFIGFNYEMNDIKWKKVYWKNNEETKYSISNIGIVRNDKSNKLLKTNFYKGYERVVLSHNGGHKQYFIHRLVATAFIPNPENKEEVNHINGIKSCNYDYNLEWVTPSENKLHAFKTGLMSKRTKKFKKLTNKQIEKICKYLEKNKLTIAEIAKRTGTSRKTVSDIYRKETHTDISHLYNIDNYEIKREFKFFGKDNGKTKYTESEIKNVCKLIDSGKYSLREIEKLTNIPYQEIRNVYYGSLRKDITGKYEFIKSNLHPIYEKKKEIIIKACELFDKGLNTREVAEALNFPRSILRKVFSGQSWREVSKDYEFMKNKLINKSKTE